MKQSIRYLATLLLVMLVPVLIFAGCASTARKPAEKPKTNNQAAKPAASATPIQIATKNNTPKGCLDCHANKGPGKDYSLKAEAMKVGGKDHPPVQGTSVKECLGCHGGEGLGAGGKSFKTFLHKAHLNDKSAFVTKYNGTCNNCHMMQTNGLIVLKGAEQAQGTGTQGTTQGTNGTQGNQGTQGNKSNQGTQGNQGTR